ncbi:MAG: hypothetical protein HY543_00945 [Deltaproteobacteria bacterium]|nr:hypothetical protein [Deltaproteobacteria bacterium]
MQDPSIARAESWLRDITAASSDAGAAVTLAEVESVLLAAARDAEGFTIEDYCAARHLLREIARLQDRQAAGIGKYRYDTAVADGKRSSASPDEGPATYAMILPAAVGERVMLAERFTQDAFVAALASVPAADDEVFADLDIYYPSLDTGEVLLVSGAWTFLLDTATAVGAAPLGLVAFHRGRMLRPLPPEVIERLAMAIECGEEPSRDLLLAARRMQGPSTFAAVLEELRHPSAPIRQEAGNDLRRFARDLTKAQFDALRDALRDPTMGDDGKEAIVHLLGWLAEQPIQALPLGDEAIVAALLACMAARSPDLRARAQMTLAILAPRIPVSRLLKALESPDEAVWVGVIAALAKTRSRQAIAPLRTMLSCLPPSHHLRPPILLAIRTLEDQGRADPEAAALHWRCPQFVSQRAGIHQD